MVESLPNALYRVELETERRPADHGPRRRASGLLRILPGEAVVVELMAYDPARGRIVRRRT